MIPPALTRLAPYLAVLALLVTWLIVRAVLRARLVRPGTWITLNIRGAVSEIPPMVPWWRRFIARGEAVHSLMALRKLAGHIGRDKRITGVVLRLGELRCGWATAASLRDIVMGLRESGKRVVVYLPYGGMTRELYIAIAADKVVASPQASLAPLGVASGMSFYQSLLARGGVDTEILARREFKSAAESFTRDSMSDANRLQMTALLDTLHDALLKAIMEGRKKTEVEARAIIDSGAFRATEGVTNGMIDAVAYDDELVHHLGDKPPLLKAWRYMMLRERRAFGWLRKRRGRRVGIVEVHGAIVVEAPVALGRVAASNRIVGALRAARANRSIAAVVLYVDSPGGSALASDLIAREVARLREKKPVVAYFSDVSASGGYYVSAPANEIIAQPVTVTGSIGVIAMRFVFERTLEKLGIKHETIRRGARADMMSPYRHWNDDERALMDHQIDDFYTDFVAIVAKGRGKTPAEIEPLARGRVYSGRDAMAVGLVDRLGGLDVALARAATLGNVAPALDPVLVHPPRELPEPPEPPAPLQPIVSRLGSGVDLINLALNGDRERLFAFEDRFES